MQLQHTLLKLKKAVKNALDVHTAKAAELKTVVADAVAPAVQMQMIQTNKSKFRPFQKVRAEFFYFVLVKAFGLCYNSSIK